MDTQVQQAFETTLRESYDDRVTWSIYADWLIEQGDPRGELMQVQLALEDETLPEDEREQLEKQEENLLHTYMEEFLGDLAPMLVEVSEIEVHDWLSVPTFRRNPNYRFTFRRGFLTDLWITVLRPEMEEVLPFCPEARFLQKLKISRGSLFTKEPFPSFQEYGLELLLQASFLDQLKTFEFRVEPVGARTSWNPATATFMSEFLRRCPQLETLITDERRLPPEHLFQITLPRLKTLEYRFYEPWQPIDPLTQNASLSQLETLSLSAAGSHSEEMLIASGTLTVLADSPHLQKLKNLRLVHTAIDDDELINWTESGTLPNLHNLTISGSHITDEGIRELIRSKWVTQLRDVFITGTLTNEGRDLLNRAFPPR